MIEFVDPSSQVAADLLGALDKEIDALDLVVLRSRTLMLLHATGAIELVGRASSELDQASVLLDRCSIERSNALAAARQEWGIESEIASELVEAAPEMVSDMIADRFDQAKSLLDEYMAVTETVKELVATRSESVARRRSELDRAKRGDVTYRPS